MDPDKMSPRELIASDLPASEVISTLSKRVYNSELHSPEYNYVLTKLTGAEMVFDGLKDVNYSEYITTTADDPYADATVDDFNGDTNKGIRDTVEATNQSNVKTKILNSILLNFKANPQDSIATVYQNTVNIEKAQELFWEQQIWNRLVSASTTITKDTTGLDAIDVNKLIYETIIKYNTTSKNHEGVGVNGLITTDDGNTVQPSMRFNSEEFVMISAPDFETDTVFDGERSFFNWKGKTLQLSQSMVLDFENYEGISIIDKTSLIGTKAIILHKDTFLRIMDWQGAGQANSGKLYTIITNYLKTETYKRLDKPIIIFKDVPALPSIENLEKEIASYKSKLEKTPKLFKSEASIYGIKKDKENKVKELITKAEKRIKKDKSRRDELTNSKNQK